MKVRNLIKKFKNKTNNKVALNVTDKKLIEKFTNDKNFPRLISFPRTGSHWLRMMMELYFEKPSLVEIYFYKNAKDYTCYHHHDVELDINDCLNVIYLYRDPVDTMFSQLSYYEENIDDKDRINYWMDKYIRHLDKWLFTESFTKRKVIITYEELKYNLNIEFKKVCKFFNLELNEEYFATILNEISKEKLKQKATHDNKVVNTSEIYNSNKEYFRKMYSIYIYEYFKSENRDVYNKIMKIR